MRPISWLSHADYKSTEITITVLCVPQSTDARPPFAEWVVQPWWKGKVPTHSPESHMPKESGLVPRLLVFEHE